MRRESHVQFCEGAGVKFPRATRLVIGFEHGEDAERVMEVLPKRMGKYGLTLHPEKTRLLRFEPPSQGDGKGTATFDFLGMTFYWRKTRRGGWRMWCKTRRARQGRTLKRIAEFCRRNRHAPVKEQHAQLISRLRGHYNYFGVNGNLGRLMAVWDRAKKQWYKWLSRRSQKTRLSWQRYNDLLKAFPLPRPRIVVQIW